MPGRGRARRRGTALALAVVVATTVLPAGALATDGRPGAAGGASDLGPAPLPHDAHELGLVRAEVPRPVTRSASPAAVDDGAMADAIDPAAGDDHDLARQALLASTYYDYCGDSSSTVDLRSATILDGRGQGEGLGFAFETCRTFAPDDLAGGVTLFLQDLFSGRMFYVDVYGSGGRLRGLVYDLDRGRVVHSGDAARRADGRAGLFTFPTAAIGDPSSFRFYVAAYADDGATVVDVMPEDDEVGVLGGPFGVWPEGACDVAVLTRRTVTAEPGRLADALAAARAAGLTPVAVSPEQGRFEVVARDEAAAEQVAALDAVATATVPQAVERAVVDATPVAPAGAGIGAWWRVAARVPAAPEVDGAGVTVGIVDDGVDGRRVELGTRVVGGYDVGRGRVIAPRTSSDRGGHGTAVAGVVAASSSTTAGVAPRARLRSYPVFDFAGCGTDHTVAAAVDRAVADGVDVLNLSLGSPEPTGSTLAAALERAHAAGTVVVAASGNEGRVGPASSPGDHPRTIAVGATGPDGTVTDYSNGGPWLDLVAPGGVSPASAANGIVTLGEADGYSAFVGTSFATPVVTGAVALALDAGARANGLRSALRTTARDLPPAGFDQRSGHGLIDVGALLDRFSTEPVEPIDPAPPVPRARSIDLACANADLGRFTDTRSSPHRQAISCLALYEVTSGIGDDRYGPAGQVTRGQMATFIANTVRAAGGSLPAAGTGFDDTDRSPHRVAIGQLNAAGIVSGVGGGRFAPERPVERGQMATFLVRALEHVTGGPLPSDGDFFADDGASAHRDNIDRAATAGLTGGDGTGNYRPGAAVTRAQMGSFLARTIAYAVDEGHATPR